MEMYQVYFVSLPGNKIGVKHGACHTPLPGSYASNESASPFVEEADKYI